MQQTNTDQSFGELFATLAADTSGLVRQEIALAAREMGQKASTVGRDIGFMAAGGVVAYAGLLAVIGSLILLLAIWIPAWISALVVGLVVIGIGYGLIQKGMSDLRNFDPMPRRTLATLSDDIEWAKGE